MSNDTTNTQPLTLDERLAAARAAREDRLTKQSEEDKARRVAILELEARLSAEFGRRGEDFEIVDAGPDGPIGIKPASAIAYKTYRQKIMREKDTQEDLIAFVNPCVVYPETKAFQAIVAKRGALYDPLGAALLTIGGLWEGKEQGK